MFWKEREKEKHYVDLLKENGFSEILSELLVLRDIKTPEKARDFLSDDFKPSSPFSFQNMFEASSRFASAISEGETIGIYGDADADGITSAAVIFNFLKDINHKKILVKIPSRDKEGYGLKKDFVDYVKENGGKIIITTDCGIKNIEEIEYAKENGIDVIVCDHHTREREIPKAYILHTDFVKEEKLKYLSGVGVAFELVAATGKILRDKGWNIPRPRKYLDLVAIGTIGDLVPLQGDNRIFVKYGIKMIMSEEGNKGIKHLAKDIKEPINSFDIQMILVPRINSPGRLGNPEISFRLLTSDDNVEEIANEIIRKNEERKIMVQDIMEMMMEEMKEKIYDESFIVASGNWHSGIVGLLAGRLCEMYGLPTCVISVSENIARGSVRSPEWLKITGVLKRSKSILKFGGHDRAAGIELLPHNIEKFKEEINSIMKEIVKKIPEKINFFDAYINLDKTSISEIREILLLEPFGEGNPNPILLLEGNIVRAKVVGKEENHIKIYLKCMDGEIEMIKFRENNIENIFSKKRIKVISKFRPSKWNKLGFDFEAIDFL